MIKSIENFMNAAEDTLTAQITSLSWKCVAKASRLIAAIYLRKERVAVLRKQVVRSVDYRMAHAVWMFRAQQAERRVRHA